MRNFCHLVLFGALLLVTPLQSAEKPKEPVKQTHKGQNGLLDNLVEGPIRGRSADGAQNPEDEFSTSSRACFAAFEAPGPKGALGTYPEIKGGNPLNDSGIVQKLPEGYKNGDPGITEGAEQGEKVVKRSLLVSRSKALQDCLLNAVARVRFRQLREKVACSCKSGPPEDSSSYPAEGVRVIK